MLKKFIWLVLIVMMSVSVSMAQDSVDGGLWGEATFTTAIDNKTDLFFGGRLEARNNARTLQEGRVFLGLALKRGRLTVSPTYIFIRSNTKTGWVTEQRPSINLSYKLPINSKKWGASLGMRNEFRLRTGKDSYKAVPTVTIQRTINKTLSAYQRTELWLDTRKADPTQYRTRFVFGLAKALNKNVTIEPFYMYSHDTKVVMRHHHRLGMNLKVRLPKLGN